MGGIKANSSPWAHEQGFKFSWQQGYGAFSVSASVVPTVVRYIQNQEAHHRKMNFEAEFVALLKKHGVEFDPKFAFGDGEGVKADSRGAVHAVRACAAPTVLSWRSTLPSPWGWVNV